MNLFRLTRNFRLGEWSVSESFPELVEPVPDAMGHKVVKMATEVLQPLRNIYGPIGILSGYRSPELNTAVGGSPTSQHMVAEAVDISNEHVQHIFWDLKNTVLKSAFPVGQVILYGDKNFVHIALESMKYSEPTFFVR